MTRRENSSRRRPPHRQPFTRILVICGGLRTEPDYFKALTRWVRNPAVRVKIAASDESPSDLVRTAAKYARRTPDDFDQLWCVFDVDDFSLDDAERVSVR